MSNKPLGLTRNQLSEFLPNQRTIRAFEQLLKQVGDLLPSDVVTLNRLIEEAYSEASSGSSKSNQALSMLNDIARSLDLLSSSPRAQEVQIPQSFDPRFVQQKFNELSDASIKVPAAGNLLIYDATLKQWKNALLTPGTNVTITNADGSVTINVAGAAPTGAAGGVLSGTYPNPGFAVDMATQVELDAHTTLTAAHGATGAVVGTTNSQTLANKTLTNPVVNGFTGDTSIVNIGSGQFYKSVAGNVGINNATPDAYGGRLVIGNFSATGATSEQLYMATNKAIFTVAPDGATNAAGVTLGVGWANGGQGPLKVAIGAAVPMVADTVSLRPGADNTYSSGTAANRWSVIYSATALINTSDARDKTEVRPLDEREIAAAIQMSKELGSYQFLYAINEKGSSARQHIGMTVQRAIEILSANGLDPFTYSFICHDVWDEEVVVQAAVEACEEQPAEYKTQFMVQQVIIDSEPQIVKTQSLVEVKPRVEAREASPEVRTVVRPAGDKYGFRTDELLMFIARGFEARLGNLEQFSNGEPK